MKRLDWLAVFFGLLLGLVLTGCGDGKPAAKPRIVASTSIIADWIKQLGREDIELSVLAGPESDPHAFQPAPGDAAAIEEAAVLVCVGTGYETWLPGLRKATRTRARVVELAEGLPLIELEEDQEGHEGHAHGEDDPHFWHDPELAMQAVSEIANALKPVLPGREAELDRRSADYQEQLRQMNAEIKKRAETVPLEKRKLVTSHDSFAYFARRYGFEVVGSSLGSLSTEASRPSASDLAALIGAIKRSGVPSIFPENTLNPALVQQIAREAGVKVAPPLLADALNAPGKPGATYLEMMRSNAETICTALAGHP